jgi:hypothetical protein
VVLLFDRAGVSVAALLAHLSVLIPRALAVHTRRVVSDPRCSAMAHDFFSP